MCNQEYFLNFLEDIQRRNNWLKNIYYDTMNRYYI